MGKSVLYRVATILCGLAVVIVGTASWSYIHQAETPDELLK